MTMLKLLGNEGASRDRRDRLELLTALMDAPGFDPLYRSDLIAIPPRHPVYGWECAADACGRIRLRWGGLCHWRAPQWREARNAGSSRAAFLAAASPGPPKQGIARARCMICPDRPARLRGIQLCQIHEARWRRAGGPANEALQEWLNEQAPFPGYGECQVEACPDLAAEGGLCPATWTATERRDGQAAPGCRSPGETTRTGLSGTPARRSSSNGARWPRRPTGPG